MATMDWSQMGQLVFALALVIALIFAIGWSVRRVSGVNAGPSRHLKMIAAIPVGARERIAVIEVGERQILVGITSQQITRLMELPEPLDVSRVDGEFARNLQSLLRRSPDDAKGTTDDPR